jgi:large subunit ribosomal protein L21
MEDYKNITATVLKQFSGVKFLVYKMKPKKKMRRKQGFRNKLTRILIDNL